MVFLDCFLIELFANIIFLICAKDGNYSTTMTVKYTMDQHKIAQYRNLPMATEPPRKNVQNNSIISME